MPSESSGTVSGTPARPHDLNFGSIVLVPFPFTSQAASKQRPGVVVSSRAYNLERPDLIMMAVTSQLRILPESAGRPGMEVLLHHWQAAGLLKPSAVKPVFATFERRLVIRILGNLAGEDQEALRSAIGRILG